MTLLRVLTDHGRKHCVKYRPMITSCNRLYINHTRRKPVLLKRMASMSGCIKTIKLEFFKIVFRKKINTSLVELQQDLDQYMIYYNCKRPHSSRHYDGRTSA